MQTNKQTHTPTYSSPAVVWLALHNVTHVSRSITCKTGKDSSFSSRQRESVFPHVQGHDLMYSLYCLYYYYYCYLISLSVKKKFLRADFILISDGQDINISHSFRVYKFLESRIVFQILHKIYGHVCEQFLQWRLLVYLLWFVSYRCLIEKHGKCWHYCRFDIVHLLQYYFTASLIIVESVLST
jgi:hypothetical protein